MLILRINIFDFFDPSYVLYHQPLPLAVNTSNQPYA
jgi:hypothetical protein